MHDHFLVKCPSMMLSTPETIFEPRIRVNVFLTGASRADLSASALQKLDGKGFAIHVLDVCEEYIPNFESLSETGSNDLPGL